MRFKASLAVLCFVAAWGVQRESIAGDLVIKAPTQRVTYTLVENEISGLPGETVIVHVKAEVIKGWHTYSVKKSGGPKPTVIEVGPSDLVNVVEANISYDPKPHIDELWHSLGTDAEAFENTFTIAIPLKIADSAKFETQKLTLNVSCQVCDANHCVDQGPTELTPTLSLKKKINEATKEHTWTPSAPGLTEEEVEFVRADDEAKFDARPGQVLSLHIKAFIANEWHISATKQDPKLKFVPVTTFLIEPKDAAVLDGEVTTDRAPKSLYDHTLIPPGDVNIFENAVVFTVPVQLKTNLKPGVVKLKVKIESQACKEQCIPVHAVVETEVEISGNKVAGATDKGDISKDKGFWAFISAAAFYGLISLLTPCVFPMIPITVSFFTKRQHISHTRAVRDALIFSFGIVLTFVGLGFFMALVMGQSVRDLATNPWMNLGIFAVFMVMAGNLLGYYELQIPSGIVNVLNKKASNGNSIYSLLLMGFVFSLTSFTCTGPFVGTVMVWAAAGDWVWPLVGMAVFATVFATPFFLLALFPTMLKSLPKSGGWMNSVKVVMGLMEIAAALKFLSSADLVWHWHIVTHEVFIVIWMLLALVTIAYLVGKVRFPHDTPLKKLGAFRIVVAAVFFAAFGLLAADLAGKPEALGVLRPFPPPRPYPPNVKDDWNTGMAMAQKAGKPVFFDFTGLTCVNCRLMEEDMFQRKEVVELLKNYVVIRLYTDARDTDEQRARSERNSKDQLDRYNIIGLPFYAIVSPEGKDLATFPEGYTQNEKQFTDFLKSALPSKTATVQVPSKATAQN